MDILKQEIERKRKQAQELSQGKKYFKRSELEKQRQQEYLEKQKQLTLKRNSNDLQSQIDPIKESTTQPTKDVKDVKELKEFTKNISKEELVKRLRAKKLPIKLFGESFQDRINRLVSNEASKEHSTGQQSNDFAGILQNTEEELALQQAYGLKPSSPPKSAKTDKWQALLMDPTYDPKVIHPNLYDENPELLHKCLGVYFKKLYSEWEETLSSRSEFEKYSEEGKRQSAICAQTREYMKPFYKGLLKRQIEKDVILRISEIVQFMLKKEYQLANDVYLRLSIGNAPWPIGVKGVSIHERSALERLEGDNVAHVLNDESARKWIQSIKRLLTFCQSKYPSLVLSKNVG